MSDTIMLLVALVAVSYIWLVLAVIALTERVKKLEWWIESLENRKADKGLPVVLDGDEWKQGVEEDERSQ